MNRSVDDVLQFSTLSRGRSTPADKRTREEIALPKMYNSLYVVRRNPLSSLGFHDPLFHPNSPLDFDGSQKRHIPRWQKTRTALLSIILDHQATCHFCQAIESLPAVAVAGLLNLPLLCFCTSTAIVEIQTVGRKTRFKTRTGRTDTLGLRVFVPSGEVKKVHLIVLGDLSYIQMNRSPAVAVIAIRWERDIAYREAFGLETVAYRDWEEVEGVC